MNFKLIEKMNFKFSTIEVVSNLMIKIFIQSTNKSMIYFQHTLYIKNYI